MINCYSPQASIFRALDSLMEGWLLLRGQHKEQNPHFGDGIDFAYLITHILTLRIDLGRRAGHTSYIGTHAKKGDLVILNTQQKQFSFNFSFETAARTLNIRTLTTNMKNNDGVLFEIENLILVDDATIWVDDYSYLSAEDKYTLEHLITKCLKSYNNSVIKLG
jgi:hypothetical protein